MIANAMALLVTIGIALMVGNDVGDWIGRKIFGVDKTE